MTIVQVTTVHSRYDIRIFNKECLSIHQLGQIKVVLAVADGKGDETASGIDIFDLGKPNYGRLGRMLFGNWRIWRALHVARPKVVHFHDPELILMGLALKMSGLKVVYDIHEDTPRQILDKDWIPWALRSLASKALEALERLAAKSFDKLVPATPQILDRFPKHKTVLVQNFPRLTELVSANSVPYHQRSTRFAYLGGITRERGIFEMIRAIGLVPEELDCRLELAGRFIPRVLEEKAGQMTGWSRVIFRGWVSRPKLANILGNSLAGLVLFHPLHNHLHAQPNKLFEYMSAGIPVIASDFPLWRRIIEERQCGLLVDPLDPVAIARAMQWILDHPEEARGMGRQGQQAVQERYNWGVEEAKLLSLYEELLI